jgi:hypothetical protein
MDFSYLTDLFLNLNLTDNPYFLPLIFIIIIFAILIAGLFILRAFLHAQAQSGKAFHRTIILIKVPKERKNENVNDETIAQIREQIAVSETIFSAMAGLHDEHGFHTWLYGRSDHAAFEIVVKDNQISFYLAVPEKIKDFMEQQIHAQYPHAEISEEPDYNIFKPQSHVVGAYLWFKHDSAFPFKNYQKMDSDPLVAILNPLSKILENEGAIIQYVVRPAGGGWRKHGAEIIKKIREGKKLESIMNKKWHKCHIFKITKNFHIDITQWFHSVNGLLQSFLLFTQTNLLKHRFFLARYHFFFECRRTKRLRK